jgi:hypothetical protein
MTDAGSHSDPQHDDPVPPTPRSLEGFKALGFFAADYAAVESGKLYVSGGYWTVLRFHAFPATFPSCAIAAVIRVPFHASQADHSFYIGLEDFERRPLPLKIEGDFRIAPGIDSRYGEPGVMPLAAPIHGLSFEQPGDYSFLFKVDNNEIARYHFRVIQVAAARFAPAPPAQ